MANKKISDLTAGSALTGAELIEIEQSGSSAKAALNGILKTYLDTLYAPASTTITSPVAWTPTFTGFGTATAITAYSWRVGSELFFEITATLGTTTAAEGRISLGYNGTDGNVTTASTYPTLQLVGSGGSTAASGASVLVLAESSKTYVTFGHALGGVSNGLAKVAGSAFGSSSTLSIKGSVRVNGW